MSEELKEGFEKLGKIALDELVRLAQEALEKSNMFHSFEMKNGDYHFYDNDGREVFDYWACVDLREFHEQYDDCFELTNNAVTLVKTRLK